MTLPEMDYMKSIKNANIGKIYDFSKIKNKYKKFDYIKYKNVENIIKYKINDMINKKLKYADKLRLESKE